MNIIRFPRVFSALFSVGLFVVTTFASGCHEVTAQTSIDESGPKVSGDNVTFPPTVPVTGIKVAAASDGTERSLQLPGRLTWDEDKTVRVFTPFAGRVTDILVEPGQVVKAGQTLAVITSPDFGIAQSEYHKAQAALQLSNSTLERQKDLYEHGVTATKDLQQAQADHAAAQAEADRSSARIKLFGDSSDSVTQRFTLKSPINGIVVEKNLNRGQELRPDQPGAPQFVVTDPNILWVQLDAAESDLSGLMLGMNFTLHAGADKNSVIQGRIEQIADYLDPVARTVKLRGVVTNPARRLKSEMYVNATLPLPRLQGPTVPATAVFLEGEKHYVFVAQGPTSFTRHEVQVGTANKDWMPLTAGVKPGEKVVTEGAVYLAQLLKKARQF